MATLQRTSSPVQCPCGQTMAMRSERMVRVTRPDGFEMTVYDGEFSMKCPKCGRFMDLKVTASVAGFAR